MPIICLNVFIFVLNCVSRIHVHITLDFEKAKKKEAPGERLLLLTDVKWQSRPPYRHPPSPDALPRRPPAEGQVRPAQHPPPFPRPRRPVRRLRHGRPQTDVALWHAAALAQLVPHPLLPLPEGGKPGVGGREGAAAAERSAQPAADQAHPHLLSNGASPLQSDVQRSV